jgi:hypothetical protein
MAPHSWYGESATARSYLQLLIFLTSCHHSVVGLVDDAGAHWHVLLSMSDCEIATAVSLLLFAEASKLLVNARVRIDMGQM